MSINQGMFEALQAGVNELQKARGEQQVEKLKAYLQDQARDKNVKAAQDLFDKNKGQGGGSADVSDTGAKIGTKEFNPYAAMLRQQSGDNQAAMAAGRSYNQGATKIQQQLSALQQGISGLNDPHNPMARGELAQVMTRAAGLNRFPNETEFQALVPRSLWGVYNDIKNAALNGDQNPLNDAQRSAANRILQSIGHNLHQQHDSLKQNSLNLYQTSPYANPAGLERLSNLGGPLDKQLTDLENSFSAPVQKAQTQAQIPAKAPVAPPQAGIVDKLKSFFNVGPSQPQQQSPQQPSGGIPTADQIAAEIAKRKQSQNTGQ